MLKYASGLRKEDFWCKSLKGLDLQEHLKQNKLAWSSTVCLRYWGLGRSWGRSRDSPVKNISCSSWLDSQNPHTWWLTLCNRSPRDLVVSSGLCSYCAHVIHKLTCRQALTHIFKKTKNKTLLKSQSVNKVGYQSFLFLINSFQMCGLELCGGWRWARGDCTYIFFK